MRAGTLGRLASSKALCMLGGRLVTCRSSTTEGDVARRNASIIGKSLVGRDHDPTFDDGTLEDGGVAGREQTEFGDVDDLVASVRERPDESR